MRFYVGKRLGKGWGVGTSISTRGTGGLFSGIVNLFLIFLVIGLLVTYWQIAILVFILWIALMVYLSVRKKQLAQLAKASKLVKTIQKHTDMIENGKTLNTKLNNCDKAIALLEEVAILDPNEKVIQNRTEMLSRINSAKKVLPIMDALQKVEKAEFKGQKKPALNAILDALFQCREANVTDSDFEIINLTNESDGKLVTIEYLTQKAKDLGWESDTEIKPI